MDFSKITNIWKKKTAVINADFSDGVGLYKDKYTEKGTLTLYGLSLYTNKAIDKRAESLAEIKFVMKNNKDEVIETAESQKLLNLFQRPNKIFSGAEFWRLYQIYKDVCGQAFILLERKKEGVFSSKDITAMHLLNPDKMRVLFDEVTGEYKMFEYETSKGKIQYRPDEIIRDFRPDPKNQLNAVSLLSSGIKNIATGIQLEDYQAGVLENGGKIEAVIKFKGALNPNQLREVKSSYREQYSEAKRAGLPLFLGGDGDYMRIALTPEELGYIQSKGLVLNDICLMTGVPKVLLSNVDDIKYSNSEESRAVYLRDTINPLMKSLVTKLDWSIVPDTMTLSYVDPTPENREEKRKDLETADKIYAMTINEKREEIGLDRIDGGDDILIPFNLVPLGTDTTSTKTFDNTEVKKKTENPLSNYETRRAYHKAFIRSADREEKLFIRILKQYFREQAKRVIESMNKKGMNEFFNKELEISIGFKQMFPVLTDIMLRQGKDKYDDFRLSANISSWLNSRVDIFMRQINDTTFKELDKQFQESTELGESRDLLVKRVEKTYGNIEKTRAKLIARTEVHGAMQKANIEGYSQSGATIKIWVAVMDSDTRDSHQALDGEEVDIRSPFSNGLMYPGDANGSAENTINCRCTI